MPKLEPYTKKLDYSYALGAFASVNLINTKPDWAKRLLINPQGEKNEGVELLKQKCAELGIRCEEAERVLRRESKKDNCYVGMVFEKREAELDKDSAHAVLCQITDSGNLGTALRALLGFGFENIAIIRPAVDHFDPKVVRASMGAFFSVNIKSYDCFEDYQNDFPKRDLYPFMLNRTALTLDEAAKSVQNDRFSLIFGNEQSGLPKSFAEKGKCVFIPQSDKIDSLNLAMAVTLGAYAFRRI